MEKDKFCPLIKDWCFDACVFRRTIIVHPATSIMDEFRTICMIAEALEKYLSPDIDI